MADLLSTGAVAARCPGCGGSLSTYQPQWNARGDGGRAVQAIVREDTTSFSSKILKTWDLFIPMKCSGCHRGGLAHVRVPNGQPVDAFPLGDGIVLLSFYPEAGKCFALPSGVPKGITAEFREAEKCRDIGCFRAAAGLFRSVLDKVMRDNGYKKVGSLEKQIDAATDDGVITAARKKRAHEDIRVLGNDVLHDEWHEILEADVDPAHHYSQRILEDFYADRQTVLDVLRSKGRVPSEDSGKPQIVSSTAALPTI